MCIRDRRLPWQRWLHLPLEWVRQPALGPRDLLFRPPCLPAVWACAASTCPGRARWAAPQICRGGEPRQEGLRLAEHMIVAGAAARHGVREGGAVPLLAVLYLSSRSGDSHAALSGAPLGQELPPAAGPRKQLCEAPRIAHEDSLPRRRARPVGGPRKGRGCGHGRLNAAVGNKR